MVFGFLVAVFENRMDSGFQVVRVNIRLTMASGSGNASEIPPLSWFSDGQI